MADLDTLESAKDLTRDQASAAIEALTLALRTTERRRRRMTMAWFKVDDNYWSHPKVMFQSLDASGLWVRAASWSANHLTDGSFPVKVAHQIIPRRAQAIDAIGDELEALGTVDPRQRRMGVPRLGRLPANPRQSRGRTRPTTGTTTTLAHQARDA